MTGHFSSSEHCMDSNEHFLCMTSNGKKGANWSSPKRHLMVPWDQSGENQGSKSVYLLTGTYGGKGWGKGNWTHLKLLAWDVFYQYFDSPLSRRNEMLFINFLCISANLLDYCDYSESRGTHSLIFHLAAPCTGHIASERFQKGNTLLLTWLHLP